VRATGREVRGKGALLGHRVLLGHVPAGGAAPEVITNWGQRCCAKDIAELRAALTRMQVGSQRLQGPALQQLGRRTSAGQIGSLLTQVNAALDAFSNTRDAAAAATALGNISRQLDALAKLITGTQ